MRRHLMPLLLLSVFALTGCGVTGSLKTPPPLFGDSLKTPPVEDAQNDQAKSAEEEGDDEDEDLLDILEELND